ncbi:MAG: asparagine synthase (glutamine-hydrolyzing) [Cyclobacteriaceae bacterium]|jgi:asparagine synthase (glutamine-hydrolysing)|nr:asparagine synthase (glutamine-hydrolyzing) [Cyclobacteriaceae bacterium]
MCGITGIFAFNLIGKMNMIHLAKATMALARRGPDFQDIYHDSFVGLGHRRLSIIDTSEAANQPMWDNTQRYAIAFNGEIFNFRELRQELQNKGVSFFSQSDTEVLLKLYIHEKEACLNRLNGFFAFCIYDKQEQTFFLARDRYGVKPLLYLYDEDKFLFASEMKSLLQYGIDKTLDYTSLYTYLQLNYIPAPNTIFQSVKKLLPGHWLKVGSKQLALGSYYSIPYDPIAVRNNTMTYDEAKEKFRSLLEASVQRRLEADVPLGAFLSGGIDSSVITGLATRHKPDLHTFSIGFRDEKFFDETEYARLVARHFQTEHTVFSLSNDDLYQHVHTILNYLDEPFADSSAINVYILSKETRKHATVALSGDGADELLGGYNKHAAHYRVLHRGWKENLVGNLLPFWKVIPQSRNNPFSNKARQFRRFADGMNMSSRERYWRWLGFTAENTALNLLSQRSKEQLIYSEYTTRKSELLATVPDKENLNDILLSDTQLVLPNDMLTKVDLMSMANGLEVRNPFLDVELVNFIFSLPDNFKIDTTLRKRILQDTYRDFLPAKLYNRPKKGFEVPLLKWLRREMKSLITDDLLSEKFISEQKIFNYNSVNKLKQQLFSSNPGDAHAQVWGLLVFQWWWRSAGINS